MIKGRFAAGILLLLASVTTMAQPERSDDGCGLLEELVRQSVYLAATQSGLEPPLYQLVQDATRDIAPPVARRYVCSSTTEAATRAFTEALAGLNMQVSWNLDPPLDRGDHCLSHYLDQCYPDRKPGDATLTPNRLAFVYDAWKGVRRALQSQMPRSTPGGISAFTSGSLESALSASLSRSVDGPLHASYPAYDGRRASR